ncbi:hypothetical protein C8R43DRAFT_1197896 [Mycena crocata]|nr:hypothetical protein C8R43DRAFT_1197896 [Mycena crocata]
MPVFSKLVPSRPLGRLAQRTFTAEAIRTLCEQNSEMNLYQPIAASAAEVCVAAKLDQRNATASLAVYAVDQVALLISPGAISEAFACPAPGAGLIRKLGATDRTSTTRISSPTDNLVEIASVGIRVAGAICEAPGLNYLKPVVGIVSLICDTAKSVKSNREAATQLARHASDATSCVVDRVAKFHHCS